MGNYSQARDYLMKLIQKYPRSGLYEQALIKFADCYFLENDIARAKDSYQDIEKKYPKSNYLPLVYLRLAQISAKEGNWQGKKKYLALLKERYPKSSEARFENNFGADEPQDFFAVQVGAFANKKNALALKKELESRYDVYILEEKKGGLYLYKVRVGKFSNRKDAENAYGRLLKRGYPARIYP
jgi:outer membrane protein assembly factor BamD (BamD/ComL family)